MKIYPLLFFILFFIVSSCAVKKRNYRPGYHIEWTHKKDHAGEKKQQQHLARKATDHAVKTEMVLPLNTEAYATANNELSGIDIKTEKKLIFSSNEICGDTIFFRRGTVVVAKVMEISDKFIKYKRCDNIDGPMIVVNKNDVGRIRYLNGVIDTFEFVAVQPEAPVTKQIPNAAKKVHPLAWWLLLLTAASFFIPLFLIPAFIIIPIARKKIKQKPDVYKGTKFINILNGICRFILILYLVIFIAILAA